MINFLILLLFLFTLRYARSRIQRLVSCLVLLLFCHSARLFAAAGDILTVTVGTEGWYADVTVEGLNVGGTYDFGWAANNQPSASNKVVFTVVSKSKSDALADTTITSLIYGTERVRVPTTTYKVPGTYTGTFTEGETVTQATSLATGIVVIGGSSGPHLFIRTITGTANGTDIWSGAAATFTPSGVPVQHGTNTAPGPREFFDGTNTTVRIALSDYVYAKDKAGAGNSGTDPTVTFLSGLYTQGGTPTSAETAFAVINNSTALYQPAVVNWSWPGYERVIGPFTLRATAFHRDAQEGRPCRVLRFTVTDGTNTEMVLVTAPEIDSGIPDPNLIVEYIADFDAADFIQGATLTCNVEAFGWVGDDASKVDSSTGPAQPTPLLAPIFLLCDKDETYGVTLALVDPVSGNDTTGQAYDSAVFNEGTAAACLTISGASAKIAAYNNTNHSRNDVGAGEIRLVSGNYASLGATHTYGTKAKTWLTITHAASTDRESVIINGKTGATNPGDLLRLYRVTLTNASNNLFSGIDSIWFDQVACDTTGTGILISGTVAYLTHCALTNMQLKPSGSQNMSFALQRGCEYLPNINRESLAHVFIGNSKAGKWNTSASTWTGDRASASGQPIPVPIFAFNTLFGFTTSSANNMWSMNTENSAQPLGGAIVQNIFEKVDDGPESISNYNAGDNGITNTPIDNVIVWHNTFVGARSGYGYNSSGSTLKHRRYWSTRGNYFEISASKTDIFGTPNGNRVGNWPLIWAVGDDNNVHGGNGDVGAPGFDLEFAGVNSFDAGTQDSTYAKFVDRRAWNGTTEGAGNGDYRLQSDSPLIGLSDNIVLPFDIAGTARTTSNNAAGAYAATQLPMLHKNDGFFRFDLLKK